MSNQGEVEDCFPFSIAFASDEGPVRTLADGVLFPKGSSFPSTKILTVHRNDIFNMEAYYSNQKELPSGVSTRISSFKIGPFRVSHMGKTKIKITVQLNLHGIVSTVSASLVDDHVDDPTSDNTIDTHSENVEPSNHESSNGPGHEIRRLKAIRRQDICIDENVYGGMTLGELCQAQERELQLAQQDIKIERTKEKKNALEAYVYDTRNKLFDTYRSFATDSEKEGISSNLQQTEEWLYEDGDDESEYIYTEKLEDLKKMVGPIENRYKDEEARVLASKNLLNRTEEYRRVVGSLPLSERDAVIGECNNAEQWLREKTQQQELLPKNADPVLWSSEITRKTEALDELYKLALASKSSSHKPEGARESDTRNKKDDMQVD